MTTETTKKAAEAKTTKTTANKYQALIDKIKEMKLTELNDFVKSLQTEFDIDPNSLVNVSNGGGSNEEAGKKTEFDVILTSVGQTKISVIKAVKKLTGKGLLEAKKMLDALPLTLGEKKSEADAEALKKEFEEAGATVEIK